MSFEMTAALILSAFLIGWFGGGLIGWLAASALYKPIMPTKVRP